MTTHVQDKYDEQRQKARDNEGQLRQRSMELLAQTTKMQACGRLAELQLESAKICFQLAMLESAVKRPTHLSTADHLVEAASRQFAGTVAQSKRQLADCKVLHARLDIVQGSPYKAEVYLREALKLLGDVQVTATPEELRANILAAFAELTETYIRVGQIQRARELFLLF